MQASKKHFEYIPVETVEQIATEFPESITQENHTIESDGMSSQPDGSLSFQQDWRRLAQQIQTEQNPKVMIELVQDLLNTLENADLRMSPPAARAHSKPI